MSQPTPESVPPRVVVAVALVRAGRLLAARRTGPAGLAGRWELPGGKVAAGEDPDHTAVREVEEELGCSVAVTGWLRPEVPIEAENGPWVLRGALAVLVAGEPVPVEHDVVRWLAPDELDDVDWLEPDRPLVADVRRLLGEEQHP